MSHPLHHSISSQKKWGGSVDDYLPIHNWFDTTRVYYREMRHRSLRHHVEGFSWCEQQFGSQIINSDGNKVQVRNIGEQHCLEDVGFIPTIKDFLDQMFIKNWMSKSEKERISQAKGNLDESRALCMNSLKKWGGKAEDYLPIHNWFDETMDFYPDVRHCSMRHHVEGIFWCEEHFGIYIINSDERMIPVRAIGEQHCKENFGFIPTIEDWLEEMKIIDWLYNPGESRNVMKDIRQNKLDYVTHESNVLS